MVTGFYGGRVAPLGRWCWCGQRRQVASVSLAVHCVQEEVTLTFSSSKFWFFIYEFVFFYLTLISATSEKLSSDLCFCALNWLHLMCCFILWSSSSKCLCLGVDVMSCTLCSYIIWWSLISVLITSSSLFKGIFQFWGHVHHLTFWACNECSLSTLSLATVAVSSHCSLLNWHSLKCKWCTFK